MEALCGTLWNLNFKQWNLYVEPCGTSAFKDGTCMRNLAEPGARFREAFQAVGEQRKKPVGSGCATLIWTSFLLTLSTFLLKSLIALYCSIEISTFSLPFYWNLYFPLTFLLKSRLFFFSIEISAFSFLLYWNLYFLFTCLLKSPLSHYLFIEISTFSLLFCWNLYFLIACLLKSLLLSPFP